MGNLKEKALNLSLLIMMINVLLFVGGAISADKVPVTSKILKQFSFNSQSGNFQTASVLQDDANNSLISPTGQSFAAIDTTNIQNAAYIDTAVFIFKFLWEVLITMTSGVIILLIQMQLPIQVIIPVAILVYGVQIIGLFDYITDFIIAIRGLFFK